MSMRTKRPARQTTAWCLAAAAFTIMLAVVGGMLLWTARTVHAQAPGEMDGPPIPGAPPVARVLRVENFPTVVLEFPCTEPAGRFNVLENGVVVTTTMPLTRAVYMPARLAIVLDVFRDDDPTNTTAGEVAANTVMTASAVLSRLRDLPAFSPFAHRVEIYVPSSAAAAPAALGAPPWSATPRNLLDALGALQQKPPAEAFPAVVTSTTAIYKILEDLIREELPSAAAERQSILLFSDGSDELSTQASFDRLVGLANGRGITVNTVYIATWAPPDPRLARLAGETNGIFVADANDLLTITNALTPVLQTRPICRIRYVAQAPPPTVIEIQEQRTGRQLTVATAYLPRDRRLTPPGVTLVAPDTGEEFTAAVDAVLGVTVTWEFSGGPPRWVEGLQVEMRANTVPGVNAPLAHAARITGTTRYTTELPLAALPQDSYRVRVTITDNLGLVASDDRYVRVAAEPPPPPPENAWTKVRNAWAGLWMWVGIDPLLRLSLIYALGLLLGILLFLAWLLVQRLLPKGPEERDELWPPPKPLGPAFALLVREQRGDPKLQSRQMVHLHVPSGKVSGEVKLPEILLEPLQQLLNPDEVAHFKSVYSAYIQCVVDATTGACRAWIGRPAFLDAGRPAHLTYMPIEIKVADAVVTFRLLPGEKDESEAARHELHNGTQIEFGDLTYRFVTLSETSLPVTVGTGDQQGAAVNGAAPVVEVYGPEKDASGNG